MSHNEISGSLHLNSVFVQRYIAMMKTLVPRWAALWYVFNVFVLPYDFFFIVLRPRSFPSGDLARYFGPVNLYARYDLVFADQNDPVVPYIYAVGFLDILMDLILCFLFFTDSDAFARPPVALLAIFQSVEVITKTLIYLMYSWDKLVEPFRVAITVMNSLWVVIPLLVFTTTAGRICNRLEKETQFSAKSQ